MDTDATKLIEDVVRRCIRDEEFRIALTKRLCKTLLPWRESYTPAGGHRFSRSNLIGQITATGQRNHVDMERSDTSLREQDFTLLTPRDLFTDESP